MPLRVLIVEDEYLVALDLRTQLELRGYQVDDIAVSVEQGLRCAADGAFDVAILDVNLAGEQVWPVAWALRDRGVPFLFLTAYGTSPPGREQLRGAPVLEKPVAMDELDCALTGLTLPEVKIYGRA